MMNDTAVPLSDEERAELHEVLQGITPLPWTADKYNLYLRAGKKRMVADDGDGEPECVARMRGAGGGEPQVRNLHAIATVMNAAPRLLSQVEQLTAKLDESQKMSRVNQLLAGASIVAVGDLMERDPAMSRLQDRCIDLEKKVEQLTKERDEAVRRWSLPTAGAKRSTC